MGSGNLEHGIKLIRIVPEYGDLLQGPERLSLTRDVQPEVQLQQSMPLPNLGMNLMIIQKTVHDYCVMCKSIDKGLGLYTPIHTSSRPCKNVVKDFDGGLPSSLCFQYIGVHVGLPMTIVPIQHF